jgi:DNA-binding response OmpR family regulator
MSTNRLLIVDDEAAIARLIEQAAREVGFEVRAIFDSQDFEKAVQDVDPNIVFLDIAMPGRDGLELIGHLAARNFTGKVVVMSGSDKSYIQMSSTIAKARGLNVGGTLEKPFRRQAILDLLRSLMNGAGQ